MKTKSQIEQEFAQVKAQMEQAQGIVEHCKIQLNKLQGQFELLDDEEKAQLKKVEDENKNKEDAKAPEQGKSKVLTGK